MVTPAIKEAASKIGGDGLTFVENALRYIRDTIESKPYGDAVIDEERKIRWSRTADKVLSDGYVYKTKGCTDLVVLFQALCEARGYSTNFLRINDRIVSINHSMA